MRYEDARSFLEKVSTRGSVLGLENMRVLMENLGNPQNEILTIHIAGTNGKGSVGAYLASIFKEAGLKVGRYCSPAVFDILECWQYDGRNISKEEYADVVSQVKNACDGIQPTVFEIETAMAFVYFKQMQADILLLETGMGGATDATNIIEHPIACIFTTISRDHMQFLGETLEEIAKVKAGIIKKEALVFSAEQEAGVCEVLSANFMQVHRSELEQKVCCTKKDCNWNEKIRKIQYVSSENLKLLSYIPGKLCFSYLGEEYQTKLSGIYQMKNAALAIEVAQSVFAYAMISKKDTIFFTKIRDMLEERKQGEILKCAIANTSWPGRFEVIDENPFFIIDGAHNEDAVKQLAITIEKGFTNQPIDFIIGILADKEHEKMLEYMMPFAGQVFTVTPPNPRGLDGKVLAEEVRKLHADVRFCDTIEEAISSARTHSTKTGNPILAFGSLSYLGQLKRICESRMRDV